MSIFTREVLTPIRDAMDGNILMLPLHLERVKDHISIRKNIYTLIGGNTGSGKTSLVDDMYVLQPYSWWQANKDKTDITFRGLYRSMERRRSLKLTKWACWRLYVTEGILIDSETLLGYKKSSSKLSDDMWNKVVSCRDWADELLDYIIIEDGRTTPDEYRHWVDSHAVKHGTLLISDEVGIYDSKTPKNYAAKFSDTQMRKLQSGESVHIARVKVGNKEYELRKNQREYIPLNPKEIVTVVADHVGKFQTTPQLKSMKETIDKASEHNADFRDTYGYSPVAISQFNRALGDTQRLKLANGDMAPILEDFKNSGNTQEDADLVLALFNPFRYKCYDQNQIYKGYHLPSMINPLGYNRYRLLSILKNSYGADDVEYGLKFMGEANYFSTLPLLNADGTVSDLLQQTYVQIQMGY